MSTVVLTGASGFIGQVVAKKLREKRIHVICVSRKSIKGMVQVSNYQESPLGDVLIHLGEESNQNIANTLGMKYVNQALKTLETLCKKFKRVVYASSALVYGDQIEKPRKEEETVSPTDYYSMAKILCEKAVSRAGGVSMRLSNVFGPNITKKNILNEILQQIYKPGPIVVKNASPIRDFVWIDDVGEAVVTLSLEKVSGIYNIGSGQGTQIGDLANLVLKNAGKSRKHLVATEKRKLLSCCVLNVSKIKNHTNWIVKTSLECGVQKLIKSKQCLHP